MSKLSYRFHIVNCDSSASATTRSSWWSQSCGFSSETPSGSTFLTWVDTKCYWNEKYFFFGHSSSHSFLRRASWKRLAIARGGVQILGTKWSILQHLYIYKKCYYKCFGLLQIMFSLIALEMTVTTEVTVSYHWDNCYHWGDCYRWDDCYHWDNCYHWDDCYHWDPSCVLSSFIYPVYLGCLINMLIMH